VISEGRFKCIGTSLFLKNTYGDGYKLNIICEYEKVDFVISKIKRLIKTAELKHQNGGSIIFTVKSISDLSPFFRIINYKSQPNPHTPVLTPQTLRKMT